MKQLVLCCIFSVMLIGCDHSNEPSLSEIVSGFKDTFSSETGIPQSSLSVKAKRINSGRWSIQMEATRYDGQRRRLSAIAVMDENGDIHYYTD